MKLAYAVEILTVQRVTYSDGKKGLRFGVARVQPQGNLDEWFSTRPEAETFLKAFTDCHTADARVATFRVQGGHYPKARTKEDSAALEAWRIAFEADLTPFEANLKVPVPAPSPQELAFIAKARELYATDETEIDDGPDANGNYPKVSRGDDGAFVAAWVWVEDEDAGICRGCGAVNADDGEGFDGMCGECADKTQCAHEAGCDTTVEPDARYFATPCGTFCDEHMKEHAKGCEICRSQFPELAN